MKSAVSVCNGERPVPPIVYNSIDDGIRRAAELGFKGIELHADPAQVDWPDLNGRLKKSGLQLSAIMTGAAAGSGASLGAEDDTLRERAFGSIRSAIELADKSGAIVAVGLVLGKRLPDAARTAAMRTRAVEQLKLLARNASEQGVRLTVEPMNRYLGTLLDSVDDALLLVEEVDEPNLGIMLDTFHMNIEEASMEAAVGKAGGRIFYVQLSDSNRRAPGLGHTNFEPFMGALRAIGYDGWVSAEILPEPDPETAAAAWSAAFKRMNSLGNPLSHENIDALKSMLNGDPVFQERGKHFRGSVSLVMGMHTWTLWFNGGKLVRTAMGLPLEGSDITINGPIDEWAMVLEGKKHLLHATNIYHGRLRPSGNLPLYASNLRPLFYLFSCLNKVAANG